MNQFKNLDTLFPCLPNRTFGEVVSVSISIRVQDYTSVISWKRKAWYVNASVNAWHMHRGLCKEFKDSMVYPYVGNDRAIRRLIAAIVQASYEAVYMDYNNQYSGWEIEVIGVNRNTYATAKKLGRPHSDEGFLDVR